MTPFSEDYYGDLDLNTLKRSQLLLGKLGGNNSGANKPSGGSTGSSRSTRRKSTTAVEVETEAPLV